VMTAWAIHVRHSGRMPEVFFLSCRHCPIVLLSAQATLPMASRGKLHYEAHRPWQDNKIDDVEEEQPGADHDD
jgi:hypothetical protein